MTSEHPRVPAVPLLAGAYLGGTVVAATVGGSWLDALVLGGFAASTLILFRWWPLRRSALLVAVVVLATVAHGRFEAGADGSDADIDLPNG